ncbi:MAG: phosphoribosylformylglycinamidine synthase [Flavobacteriales bacterium AspAUS03]
MNRRIYTEKKTPFDIYSPKLLTELQGLVRLKEVKIYNIYDLFGINEETYQNVLYHVFADPVADIVHEILDVQHPHFAIEYLPGQYDQRADAAMQCLKLIVPNITTFVRTGQLIELIGLYPEDLPTVKNYCINEVESREKDLQKMEIVLQPSPQPVVIVEGFSTFSTDQLIQFHNRWRFTMGWDDLLFVQDYFRQEQRDPTETELRVIDIYWSDQCRHTTFLTTLTDIRFEGPFQQTFQVVFDDYLETRKALGESEKPITFMDLATLAARALRAEGKLKDWVISDEINACTLAITVDVDKVEERWHLLFKNETHNHPTEIEPFGGASTCIGGAIRDPLSGRAFVYQAIRLSGAADPTEPLYQTLEGKLPQRKISRISAQGYSTYGNQIGLATTHVAEVYHEGYRAKHMEVGMVIGAVREEDLRQEPPRKSDIVLLLGGATGRDGIGGAIGSSKPHYSRSVDELNIEVQKGNAVMERKIQRFFRREEVSCLIKKCNDFGAGGVAVAVGELSRGLLIDLDQIPLKYEGLNGTELAISESQERMAILVTASDVEDFIHLAREENLLAVPIAQVTDDDRLVMHYRGQPIVDLKRVFLDTHGVSKKMSVRVTSPKKQNPLRECKNFDKKVFLKKLSHLDVASQKGLVEMFDSTVGATTVLMPFGGKYQLTPAEGTAQKIHVLENHTETVSLASWGFHPKLSAWSPFHGGAYAVVESVAKIVAMGGDHQKIRFSFQEYFQKLGTDPKNWGQPFAALLGAYRAQRALGLAAIGGKDSMSGTFKELHVPPTLISFAVATGKVSHIISPEFKKAGHMIWLYRHRPLSDDMPNFDTLQRVYTQVYEGICYGRITAVKTVKSGGIATALAQMAFGNRLGFSIETDENLLEASVGSLVIESVVPLSKDFIQLGKVTLLPKLCFNRMMIDFDEALQAWSKTLESVFPTQCPHNKEELHLGQPHKPYSIVWGTRKKGTPQVFIPVFPGTNCEYESIWSFQQEGARVNSVLFRNLDNKDIQDSIQEFEQQIRSAEILMLSGGFSAGDEPDGSAKFITALLHNPYICEAVNNLLQRNGLILGICNGFQALIKSGLLPYGQVRIPDYQSPTLTFNEIGRHVSQCVRVKVISDRSPWLTGMKDQVFIFPASHGEGRFYASREVAQTLFEKGQIATQYIDVDGFRALNTPDNPNGSVYAVEGLISEDGKIYGRMGHPERWRPGLLKNIPRACGHPIFRNAVRYFW